MKRKTKVAFFFLLGLTLLLLFAWQKVNLVLSPPKNASFVFLSPAEIGLPYEKFTLFSQNKKIFGWFIPGEKDLCIIFLSGWGGKKEDFLSFRYQQTSPLYILWEKGFSLCLFDPQGLGESEGSFDLGIHLAEDTKRVMDFLSAQQKASYFILFGFSAGANAAIRVAIERKEVIATIADSPFVSLFHSQHYPKVVLYLFYLLSWAKLGRGWAKELDLSQKDLTQLSNILLIAGKKDKVTPPDEAKFIFEKAKEPKALWIVEGADHCQAIFLFPDEYFQRVSSFLERVLDMRTLFC